jgi:tripartite-type tricarboxylate transporter receptor subunit TctC
MTMRDFAQRPVRARLKAALSLLAIAFLGGLGANAGAAEAFPEHPVKIIVPMAPGGGADISMRLLATKLQTIWKDGAFIENKAGGTGAVGLAAARTSRADGYTVVIGTASHAVIQGTKSDVPYDLLKDFEPVTQMTEQSYVLVINPKLEVNSVADLVALSKKKPGGLSYSSAGDGSLQQICGAMLAGFGGAKLLHVPYKGGGPAIAAAISGEVDIVFATPWEAMPFTKTGKLKPLAVSGTSRLKAFPDAPTMQELGMPNFVATQWYGILAPAGTPRSVVDKLYADVNKALKAPDLIERFAESGIDIVGSNPQQFREFIRADIDRSKKMAALVAR